MDIDKLTVVDGKIVQEIDASELDTRKEELIRNKQRILTDIQANKDHWDKQIAAIDVELEKISILQK